MGFIEFIERQREKPEIVKRRMLFVATVSITGLIAVIWLSIFLATSGKLSGGVETSPASDSPIEEVSGTLGSFFSSFKEGISAIESGFSATGTVLELK
jgi:hypothetical protein